ncbi:site-specific integrase [Clostridium senegalense]
MEYSTIIRKKNKGYQYVITYKLNGVWKQKSKQGFAKKGEAQIAMDKMIPELEKMVKNNVTTDKVTLRSFYNMYIKRIKLYREKNTILKFGSATEAFKDILDLELKEITNFRIQNCIDDLTARGIKGSSIKTYLGAIKVLLRSAKNDYNLISELPTFKLEIKENKNSKDKRALTKSEIELLLEENKGTRYYLIFLIALKTGMRLGEIFGLTWNNVDLINNKITVDKQWKRLNTGTMGFGELKSKNSYRSIPIPEILSNELKKIEPKNEDERIISYKNNGTRLNGKLKKYGITFHELRHTYATQLISAGIDLKTVAYLLGHDIKETMQTYSHVNKDMIENATNIIEKFL